MPAVASMYGQAGIFQLNVELLDDREFAMQLKGNIWRAERGQTVPFAGD